MASLITNKDGSRRLEFSRNGKRNAVWLGRMDADAASLFCDHVEHIIEQLDLNRPLRQETADWLSGLGDRWHGLLEKFGLVKPKPGAEDVANVFRDSNGCVRVMYYHDHKRFTLRLGKVSEKIAATAKARIESLLASKKTGQPPEKADLEWVKKLDSTIRGRVEKLCLFNPGDAVPLKWLLDQFLLERASGNDNTKANFTQCRDYLVKFFGEDRIASSLTTEDCQQWREWLASKCKGNHGLSENTVRRHCGRAGQIFRDAVKKGAVDFNPFSEMKNISVKPNAGRFHFVSKETYQAVLDACPDDKWKLLLSLARYGALRLPSEAAQLLWSDIDWSAKTMTVRAYGSGALRMVPVFPEVYDHLKAVWESSDKDVPRVFPRMAVDKNIRTSLMRIIENAGVTPWPKLLQNLRASRIQELTSEYPASACAEWLGGVYGSVGDGVFIQRPAPLRGRASGDSAPEWYGGVMTTGLEGGMMVTPLGVGCVLEMDDGKWLVRWADAETTAPSFEQAKSLCEYYYYGSIPASQR